MAVPAMTTKYNEQELLALWRAWAQDPTDKKKSSEMLAAFEPLTRIVANRYLGSQYAKDPLILGRAKIILISALKNYDETKGPIISFVWTYLQRLQRIAGRQKNVVRLSEASALAARDLDSVELDLTEKLGRPPTDEELADALRISRKKVAQLRRRATLGFESSYESAVDDGGGSLPAVVSSQAIDTNQYVELLYDSTESNRDKYILETAYGLFGKPQKTITEIAKDLNISPSLVSQRLSELNKQVVQLRSGLRI